jgi:hypothetical protein
MRTAAIVAAATAWFGLSFVGPARADTKAWTAAKAGLPADAKLVFGVDLAALQKTQVFATLWPKLLDKTGAAPVLEMMKTSCQIDPFAVVQAVVIGMSDDQEEGAGYVAVSGLDRAKLVSCLQRTVKSTDKNAKVSVKQDGNITEVTSGKDSMFLGWASKDVVVVPLHDPDKAKLVKWMAGKGALAKTAVGKQLAKVNTSAAIWGAGEGSKEVQSGVVAKGGYGALTFAKGNLSADVHARLESAAQATTLAGDANQKLDEAKQGALIPPAIVALLKTITIAAVDDEVVLKASMLESDVASVLALMPTGP